MSHRRLFLKQLAAAGVTAGLGRLVAADEALGAALARLPEEASLEGEYLLSPEITYLNHGSIGTIPRVVHEAHRAYLELCETNPWLYMWGGAWEEPREAVRSKVAAAIGAAAEDVALTHNTTEGFNLLAQGLPLGPGDEVLFSTLNHPGASVCWFHRARDAGYRVRRFPFPVREVASLSVRDVVELHRREITDRTRVLVFPHVDNQVGLRHPVAELAGMAHRLGVEFVAVDGAQSVGMLPVAVEEMGIDFYAASPHKWLQAPKGLGLLYVRRPLAERLRPMWVTWGQERWEGSVRIFEDYGTRNLPELLALGDAVEFQGAVALGGEGRSYRALWEAWRSASESAPGVRWRSPVEWALSASLFALEVDGLASPELFDRLWKEGGFVFRAFHTPELNTARISPNRMTREEERDRFFAAVAKL